MFLWNYLSKSNKGLGCLELPALEDDALPTDSVRPPLPAVKYKFELDRLTDEPLMIEEEPRTIADAVSAISCWLIWLYLLIISPNIIIYL